MIIKCGSEERRRLVKKSSKINGIDYLEVLVSYPELAVDKIEWYSNRSDYDIDNNENITNNDNATGKSLLLLYCFKPIFEIDKDNVILEGGVAVENVGVKWAIRADQLINILGTNSNRDEKTDDDDNIHRWKEEKYDHDIFQYLSSYELNQINQKIKDADHVLIIRPTFNGDHSEYTLKLVKKQIERNEQFFAAPNNFDPCLSQVNFSFGIDLPSKIDCLDTDRCDLTKPDDEPIVDYLSKDYSSFRQLMIDRISVINTAWKERSPADLGIVLIELLAYVADHLSYYQDAVGTEAYLGTARRRVSVKRHTRLLNYNMHEGCNSRVWISLKVADNNCYVHIPKQTKLLSDKNNDNTTTIIAKDEKEELKIVQETLSYGNQCFETVNDIILYHQNNELHTYTWSNPDFCLPIGATSITIRNDDPLFSWKDVPVKNHKIITDTDHGNGATQKLPEKLKKFLESHFNVDWIDSNSSTLQINKIDNGRTIRISDSSSIPSHTIYIKLNKTNQKAMIEINNKTVYELIVTELENNDNNNENSNENSNSKDHKKNSETTNDDDYDDFDHNNDNKYNSKNQNTSLEVCDLRFHIFLFNWNNVPKADDNNNTKDRDRLERFLRTLAYRYNVDWLIDDKTASLDYQKIDNGRTIRISDSSSIPSHTIYIKLNKTNQKAMIEINNKTVYELIVTELENNDNNNENSKNYDNTGIGSIVLNVFIKSLNAGDTIIFSQPLNSTVRDQDIAHAVRILNLTQIADVLNNVPLLNLEWHHLDALPFSFRVSQERNADNEQNQNSQSSGIILGNIVLAEHGYTINNEDLHTTPIKGDFCPQICHGPLSYSENIELSSSSSSSFLLPASVMLSNNPTKAKAEIFLIEKVSINVESLVEATRWYVSRDLLDYYSNAKPIFVVEVENDRTSHIRFGDGKYGLRPQNSTSDNLHQFFATYRVGNGIQGNVGANTIRKILLVSSKSLDLQGICKVTNPIQAKGGQDPEDIEAARQKAPQALHNEIMRAVTKEDYITIAERYHGVYRATTNIEWTGSWYTVFVTIDPLNRKYMDENFKMGMLNYIDKYRLTGYDIEVDNAVYVPLDVKLRVYLEKNCLKSLVKQKLSEIFSNRHLGKGTKGFFHRENFTFGQPVYLDKIIETAMQVAGIISVQAERFQRFGRASKKEITDRIITIGTKEIARLDNDYKNPEYGQIEFDLIGGM